MLKKNHTVVNVQEYFILDHKFMFGMQHSIFEILDTYRTYKKDLLNNQIKRETINKRV